MKTYSNRQPRKQSSSNSKISFLVKTSAEQEIDPAEEEELLSLSPQPSIISTVTHGATNKNSLHHSSSRSKSTTTQRSITRISAAPKIFNFGDVLFGSRSSQSSFGSRSEEKESGFGSRSPVSSSSSSSEKPINSSRIEQALLDSYPGKPPQCLKFNFINNSSVPSPLQCIRL